MRRIHFIFFSVLLYAYYSFNLWRVLFDCIFHPKFQGRKIQGTSRTVSKKLYIHQVILYIDKLDISSVFIEERPDAFQGFHYSCYGIFVCYICFHIFQFNWFSDAGISYFAFGEHPAIVVIFTASVGGRFLFLSTRLSTILRAVSV